MTAGLLFAGCGAEAEWEMDKENHWHTTAKGKQVDIAPHSFEDGITCSVCNAEILRMENDGFWVRSYNEHNDMVFSLFYDADGRITESIKTIFTYDAEGRWASEKVYENGTLFSETTYAPSKGAGASGVCPTHRLTYYEDATKLEEEYGETGDLLKATLYRADGSVEYEYTYIWEYDSKNQLVRYQAFDGENTEETRCEYDADGNTTVERSYYNDKLIRESFFAISEEFSFGYLAKEILYLDDGTQTITEFDENGNILSVEDKDAAN